MSSHHVCCAALAVREVFEVHRLFSVRRPPFEIWPDPCARGRRRRGHRHRVGVGTWCHLAPLISRPVHRYAALQRCNVLHASRARSLPAASPAFLPASPLALGPLARALPPSGFCTAQAISSIEIRTRHEIHHHVSVACHLFLAFPKKSALRYSALVGSRHSQPHHLLP